jgi:hypothetical protein
MPIGYVTDSDNDTDQLDGGASESDCDDRIIPGALQSANCRVWSTRVRTLPLDWNRCFFFPSNWLTHPHLMLSLINQELYERMNKCVLFERSTR